MPINQTVFDKTLHNLPKTSYLLVFDKKIVTVWQHILNAYGLYRGCNYEFNVD